MAEELESRKISVKDGSDTANPLVRRPRNPLRSTKLQNLSLVRLQYLAAYALDLASASLRHEFETGLGFFLVPVCLGAGIGLYFFTPAEPVFAVLCLTAGALAFAHLKVESRGTGYYLLSLAMTLLFGMAIAQFSVLRSSAPSLNVQITAKLAGTVLNVDRNSRDSPRYLILVDHIDGLNSNETPIHVRVSGRAGQEFLPGDGLSGLARLQPVSGPVLPGSYDFGFFGRFEQLGATGFFMGAPQSVAEPFSLSLGAMLSVRINQLRGTIAGRLEAALPGPKGRIVRALVIGDKTGIRAEDNEALRASGLAHILAISGLHMALVTLTVIWAARLLMVANQRLIFAFPVKKMAAVAGFCVATLYLFLSGGGIATQRAWIMVSVMLLAVLLDRKAITLRSVAISAVLILILKPQSLFAPGFQMSFAAVAALVAGYEAYYRWQTTVRGQFDVSHTALTKALRFASGLALTSLIAGSATLFISAYHFHQIASFGLLANVLAMPIVSLVLMPFILLSALIMPLGLEAVTLVPVSLALDWILGIANWVSDLTPVSNVGAIPSSMTVVFVLGFLLLVLLRTWLRVLGIVMLLMLPLFYHPPEVPDLVVAESGRAVGWKSPSGRFEVVFPARENFVTGIWSKAWAFGEFKNADLDEDQCNRERCKLKLGQAVAHIVYDPDLAGGCM